MLVDDQEIITTGLKLILSQFEDLEVIATASSGKEALQLCGQLEIHVILMDIKMPGLDGIQTIKLIKSEYPEIETIIFTTFKEDEYIKKGLSYGASGYILKDATPEEIHQSILDIRAGGAVLDATITKKLINSLNEKVMDEEKVDMLTKRELEIAILVGQGLNNSEISDSLYLSEGTIKNHLSNIFNKLNLRDRTQLAIFVHENQLL